MKKVYININTKLTFDLKKGQTVEDVMKDLTIEIDTNDNANLEDVEFVNWYAKDENGITLQKK